MKKRLVRIMGCIITVVLTVSLLGIMTNIVERKASYIKYVDFFEEKENFDVLFLGSSHVINGIYPMELWNDHGIVSYNCGGHSNQLGTSYWVMENLFDYTTPRVVVIDCLGLENNRKCSGAFSYLHMSLDAFPLTPTKVRAVWDLLDDPVVDEMIANGTVEKGEPRTKMGLLWNYSVYHSRWNELTQRDFSPTPSKEKGAEFRIAVTNCEYNALDREQKIEGGTLAEQYLRKMIEECHSRGIEVLLINIPFPAKEEEYQAANYAYDIADEYGINYINFFDMAMIDGNTDFFDATGHMNPSGARKITGYLGDYLVQNYNLTDRRDDESYAGWNADYLEYTELKDENFRTQEDLASYFVLLYGDNVDASIEVSDISILQNENIAGLLANAGIEKGEIVIDTNLADNETNPVVHITTKRDDVIIDDVSFVCSICSDDYSVDVLETQHKERN